MSKSLNRVAIVSAVRTAIGSFGGSLKNMDAATLGSIVIKEALHRCNVDGAMVDEVIMGQVYSAGIGPNPARIASLQAGLPNTVPAMTINKVCGSGLKSVVLGAQAILTNSANVVVAGGMENMSQVPFLLPNQRWGQKMGHDHIIDGLLRDGLWDRYCDCHMGDTAENLVNEYQISREQQDAFAFQSQSRYQQALKKNVFADEIVPVEIQHKNQALNYFKLDEHPREDATLESLCNLKPVFQNNGSITAGNASGINDGAAAMVLMNETSAIKFSLKPLAFIKGFVSIGVDPKIMGIGPAMAIKKLLKQTGFSLDHIDLLEVNEAFAAQTLAVARELELENSKVNVNGGAIALGHPLGASGARITVTLLREMGRRNNHLGYLLFV